MNDREPWLRVFVDGFAPNMTDDELLALRGGLERDDPRILQGATTTPPPLLCVHDWPCECACPIGYTTLATIDGATVGQVENVFANLCFMCNASLPSEPNACRFFLNWVDVTPRPEMRASLVEAIEHVLAQREGFDREEAWQTESCRV